MPKKLMVTGHMIEQGMFVKIPEDYLEVLSVKDMSSSINIAKGKVVQLKLKANSGPFKGKETEYVVVADEMYEYTYAKKPSKIKRMLSSLGAWFFFLAMSVTFLGCSIYLTEMGV